MLDVRERHHRNKQLDILRYNAVTTLKARVPLVGLTLRGRTPQMSINNVALHVQQVWHSVR